MTTTTETTSPVKTRGNQFRAEMIRSILEMRKTQARLPIHPQPTGYPDCYPIHVHGGRGFFASLGGNGIGGFDRGRLFLYGAESCNRNGGLAWCSGGEHERWNCPWLAGTRFRIGSRKLSVVFVTAERLRSINVCDVPAEGLPLTAEADQYQRMSDSGCAGHIRAQPLRRELLLSFAKWWDSLPDQQHPWASNPWVWVINFALAKDGAQ